MKLSIRFWKNLSLFGVMFFLGLLPADENLVIFVFDSFMALIYFYHFVSYTWEDVNKIRL